MSSSLHVNRRLTNLDALLNEFDFFSALLPERFELEFMDMSNLDLEALLPSSLPCDPAACL